MILGILILAFILWLSIGFNSESDTKVSCEKGHLWQYKAVAGSVDEHLICGRCSKRPGEDTE